MASYATDCILEVDGIDMMFPVISFYTEVFQSTDQFGKPNATPATSNIAVVLYGTGDISNYTQLANWAVNPTMLKGGSIAGRPDTNSDFMQGITFENAFCVKYAASYDITQKNVEGLSAYKISLLISAQKLCIGGDASIERKWPGIEPGGAAPSTNNNAPIKNNLSFD